MSARMPLPPITGRQHISEIPPQSGPAMEAWLEDEDHRRWYAKAIFLTGLVGRLQEVAWAKLRAQR